MSLENYTSTMPEETLLQEETFEERNPVYPPDLEAGKTYDLRFMLPTDKEPFETKNIGGADTLVVNYEIGYPITLRSGEVKDRTQKFQSASFYQSPKMKEAKMNSEGVRLLAALGVTPSPLTITNVKAAFVQAAAQQLTFKGVIGWVLKDKEANVYYRTKPRQNDQPWPRDEFGAFQPTIKLSNGEEKRGNIEIVGFRAPKK